MFLNECEIGKRRRLDTTAPRNYSHTYHLMLFILLWSAHFKGRRDNLEEGGFWKWLEKAILMYYYSAIRCCPTGKWAHFCRKSFSFFPEKHGSGLYKRSSNYYSAINGVAKKNSIENRNGGCWCGFIIIPWHRERVVTNKWEERADIWNFFHPFFFSFFPLNNGTKVKEVFFRPNK